MRLVRGPRSATHAAASTTSTADRRNRFSKAATTPPRHPRGGPCGKVAMSYFPPGGIHDRRHYYTQVERPARGGGPRPGGGSGWQGPADSAPEGWLPGSGREVVPLRKFS